MQSDATLVLKTGAKRVVWLVLALALMCITGCGSSDQQQTTETPAVTRTAENGPVTVTLTASPAEVDFGETARVDLEIVAAKDVTVLASNYLDALSDGDRRYSFRAKLIEESTAQPVDEETLRWHYRFEVDFYLPGEHELPPAEVRFTEVRPIQGDTADDTVGSTADHTPDDTADGTDASVEEQTVTTEPITLVVRPPAGPAPTPEELRTVTRLDPIELPTGWETGWWAVGLVLLAVAVVAMLLLRRRRRQGGEAVVVIPAHEWARKRFAELVAENFLRRGMVQPFYYGVSSIVRGYIERRYHMLAAEMTTEEFLLAAARDERFPTVTTDELTRFLTACDRVKYACHQPDSGEADVLLQTAGEFVERTREREEAPTSGEGTAAPASQTEEQAA